MKAKKLLSLLLAIVILVCSLAVSASATVVGGTYNKSTTLAHSGSSSVTQFNVTITFPNGTNQVKHVGTSSTYWMGSSPYNADSIVHKNIVSVSALGGLSFSSSGGGGSISGSQMIDEMSLKNTWKINSTFNYNLKATAFIFSSNFGTTGRVQIGSNFYSLAATT